MSTLTLGGDLPLNRLGFGAMHLTGPDVWGPPTDPAAAHAVARRAVELGVNFIDTADSYGPGTSEETLSEALFPYADGLVIGTKVGQSRPSRDEWRPLGRPEYIRQQCELSLRRLRLERIDLFQLHRIDPKVPAEEQFGALKQLQEQGKIRHIGLSEVSVEQIEDARRQIDVASVQNIYNLSQRKHEEVLNYCERENIVFIPWVPIASGDLARSDGALGRIAKQLDATPAQVALAWLLHRSPVIVPIPGTSSIAHLEENVAAGSLRLSADQVAELTAETG
ncbi:aldo/keto reductase [Actinoplanes sp. NPDC051859]|uniref:aldo/keto reductase n=1 Tax=Actinoplanes sp. NPDC051859 TaxID=3363909 RepID=UPI00379EAD4D